MYAMNTREAISALAAFAEMIEVIEWLEDFFFGKAYSNLNVENEDKKDACMEAWTTESPGKQNQIKINESTFRSSQEPKEATLTNSTLDTTETKNIIHPHLQFDIATNHSTIESNLVIHSYSISQAVSETNKELLNLKLKSTAASNVNNLDSLQPILDATENSESNTELTNTSNEDRTCETVKCSIKTIKLSNGNIVEKDSTGDRDYPEKESNLEKTFKSEEANEVYGIKKFTTSSWNLEAIMDSLYTLLDSSTSKAFQAEIFQTEAFITSQGAFCNYSEGNYTVTLEQQTLQITQESESNDLLTIPLNYGEVSFADRTTLKLDNKLGRCLFFKCTPHEELLKLKEALKIHCMTQWESECINLVHYPLKCHQNTVIVDLGSCSTRAGILMDEPTLPFIFFPSVCAIDKTTGNHTYGKEALQAEVRQNSNLSFPIRPSIKIIKHSIDIDLVEGLFKKIFYELRVDPTHYIIQVCLPRNLSICAQNALVKLLLEDFKVQSVSLTHQALLTLYAHNVSTGIVVDVGDRMDILPVVDGFIVESGVTRLPYGGQRLIHHMKHALAEKHISLSNDIDAFVVQYITENLAYVAESYEDETKIATQYPDVVRKSIALQTFAKENNCVQYATLDDARFKIPEGLFKPELWGLDNPGIHKLVQKAIQATSVDVRKKIAENIYVSGGVTLTPGFVERLFKEISHLNKPRITPKVIASNYRYHCTYIGACKFAKMDVFPKVCVNMKDYSKDQLSSLKKFVLCF